MAITGARRGELCALQVRDVDLDNGILHIAISYLVRRNVGKDPGRDALCRTAGAGMGDQLNTSLLALARPAPPALRLR